MENYKKVVILENENGVYLHEVGCFSKNSIENYKILISVYGSIAFGLDPRLKKYSKEKQFLIQKKAASGARYHGIILNDLVKKDKRYKYVN